jgi:hypothetical protein
VNEQERKVVEEFYQQNPQWRREANTSFLLERSTKPVTVESLVAAAYLLRESLLLAPDYQEEWENEKERLEREKELGLSSSYHRAEQIGTAHRIAFIEKLREKEMKEEQERLVEELGGGSFRGLPLEDLRQIAATRKENARRKSLNSAELSALAREERPTPTAPGLPWTYQPFGKTESVELTAEVLRSAGGRNSPLTIRDFKFLCERWGSDKVNERMNGSSQRRYKPLPPEVTREQVIAAMRNKELASIWLREHGSQNLNNRIFGNS